VGCSGWSYDDWVGGFYPIELTIKREPGLITTPSISEPSRSTAHSTATGRVPGQRLDKDGKDKEGFEYSLKVPQLVTHKTLVDGDKERAIFWATSFERPV